MWGEEDCLSQVVFHWKGEQSSLGNDNYTSTLHWGWSLCYQNGARARRKLGEGDSFLLHTMFKKKKNSRWIKNLRNAKLKPSEDALWFQAFLTSFPEAQLLKEKVNKLGCIKTKMFCFLLKTVCWHFLSGPVAKPPHSQCRGPGFSP